MVYYSKEVKVFNVKKNSIIIKKNIALKTTEIHNDIAVVERSNQEISLLDITTNKIVMPFAYSQDKFIGDLYVREMRENEPFVDIYDAKEKKLIVDRWSQISCDKTNGRETIRLLKSPVDGNLHIFNHEKYGTGDDIFTMGFDKITKVSNHTNNSDHSCYYIVEKDNKKGIYNSHYGMLFATKYDDIITNSDGNVFIFTDGNKKSISFPNQNIVSKDEMAKFDEVTMHENGRILFCKLDNEYYIFDCNFQNLILSGKFSDVSLMTIDGYNTPNTVFDFVVTKNDKKGLIRVTHDHLKQYNFSYLLEPIYDDIKFDDNFDNDIYRFQDNGKWGLVDLENQFFIKPQFSEFEILYYDDFGDMYLKVPKKGKFDLVYVSAYKNDIDRDSNKVKLKIKRVLTGCTSIEKFKQENQYSIYEKDGKLGIVSKIGGHFSNTQNKYDSIKQWGDTDLFEVTQNGKKGIIYFNEEEIEIVPIEYEDIDVKWHKIYPFFSSNSLEKSQIYLALKKTDDKYDFAKIDMYNHKSIEFVKGHNFDDVKLLYSIIALREGDNTYIYNYNEKLLTTLPRYETISESDDLFETYEIDGEYYYYSDGCFEKSTVEPIDYYVTTYEDDENIFEVGSFSQEKHDCFCKDIDALDEVNAMKRLYEMYNIMEKTNQTSILGYNGTTLKKIKKNGQK